jgi:MFS family permease
MADLRIITRDGVENATEAIAVVPVQHARWLTLVAPLRARKFRLLWLGLWVSLLGDNFHLVALPILILDLTQRSTMVGAVLMAAAIPRLLLLVAGGVLIDRYRPRTVMVVSSVVSGVVAAVLALLAGTGAVAVWHLFVLSVLLGMAAATFLPAATTLVPDLVPPEQVRSANALRTFAFNSARFVAPPVAGVVIAVAGAAAAFGANAVSCFVAAACLWTLRLVTAAPAVPTATTAPAVSAGSTAPRAKSVLGEFREGVQAVRRDGVISPIFVIAPIWNFGHGAATMVGIPVLAKLALAAGDREVGILFGAFGAGALVGTLIAGAAAAGCCAWPGSAWRRTGHGRCRSGADGLDGRGVAGAVGPAGERGPGHRLDIRANANAGSDARSRGGPVDAERCRLAAAGAGAGRHHRGCAGTADTARCRRRDRVAVGSLRPLPESPA